MAPLIDDVTAEILLRLPPDEPEHLFRAALVCKPWPRILCDPGFLRRYRAFHGAPPLLGLLHRLRVIDGDAPARFASTTSAPDFPHPSSDGRRTRPLDCRHGRVLVRMLEHEDMDYLSRTPSPETDTPSPRRTSSGSSSPRRCSAPPTAATTSTATAARSGCSSSPPMTTRTPYARVSTRRRRGLGASRCASTTVVHALQSTCEREKYIDATTHPISTLSEAPLSEMQSTSRFGWVTQSSSMTWARTAYP
ncbi:unnamed protein product [Triticum turgidum subsp. durum]|uniref:F-box domain-containing protein n=1 Tax=Triticum turgidum subsp. durum TaxID=4567 RepID=A0A9R0YE41_TRITD|nr:unnamed protein product [Triticum turgidum subsp. durum]